MPEDNNNTQDRPKARFRPVNDFRPGREKLEYNRKRDEKVKRDRIAEQPEHEKTRSQKYKTSAKLTYANVNKKRAAHNKRIEDKKIAEITKYFVDHPDQKLRDLPDGTTFEQFTQAHNPGGLNSDTGGNNIIISDSHSENNNIYNPKGKYIVSGNGNSDDRGYIGEYIKELLLAYTKTKVMSDKELIYRITEYFDWCINNNIPPTMEEMCLWTGYDKMTVINWGNGKTLGFSPYTARIVTRAREILAGFDTKMVYNGKMNYVLYFFRAKNYYGLRDNNTELPSAPKEEDEYSIDDIKARYSIPGSPSEDQEQPADQGADQE